ncbi:unnamed protein product [Polarella glacialis]|uniref:Calcium/calmodulin-dependent protein kinase II association-domain domain-containing protein n=1 Tax=Polarella glacialis TaxID=89957 RepID=A0A813IEE1_POLGL|nr:unnamed protein product [Polarella glacialis]
MLAAGRRFASRTPLVQAAAICRRANGHTAAEKELVDVNRALLQAIGRGDFEAYNALVAEEATCIEPETAGQIVAGNAFHKHYFDLPADPNAPKVAKLTSMTDINVRV